MIVRSNSSMTMTVLSASLLTLAAVLFAVPVDARTTGFQKCNGACQLGDHFCFVMCACLHGRGPCPSTTKNASIVPTRRPITTTGARANPTKPQVNQGRLRR